MKKLKESIEKYGILTPLIVMPTTDGIYQIVSATEESIVRSSWDTRRFL